MIVTDVCNLRSTKQIATLTTGTFSERHLRYLITENVDGFRDQCCVRTRGRWLIDIHRMQQWLETNNRAGVIEGGADVCIAR